jgi:hypothetical protein
MRKFLKIALWTLTFVVASALAKELDLTKYDLAADFARYNKDYFYGALPENTVIAWADLSEYKDMGATERLPDGRFLIRIDPKMHAVLRQADMTLLHEMCHVKRDLHIYITVGTTKDDLLDDHGDSFQSCMIDLAKRGACQNLW